MCSFSDFLSRLEGVNPQGESQATARCPAHDDRANSLSVGYRDGRVLVYCHAGCPAADVVEALGLKLADLFDGDAQPIQVVDDKGLTAEQLDGLDRYLVTGPPFFL